MIRYTILCLLVLVGRSPADGLSFTAGAYHFKGDAGPELEVVIRIPIDQLTFAEHDSGRAAVYHPHLTLQDPDGEVVKRIGGKRIAILPSVDDADDRRTQIEDVARFNVDPGDYRGTVEIGTEDGAKASQSFEVTVPAYESGRLELSEIQLVHAIDPRYRIQNPDHFRKLGHVVIPEPADTVGADVPLRWYVETYELGQLAHTVRFDVVDTFGNKVLSDVREFGPYRDEARFLEGVVLRNIPPGEYQLSVTVEAGDQRANRSRSFVIQGKSPRPGRYFTEKRQGHARSLLKQLGASDELLNQYDRLNEADRARLAYGYAREASPLLATTYVGPLTGLGRHEVGLSLLRAIKQENNVKKRVDRTFGERLPEPDTLSIRRSRESLKVILDAEKGEPFAMTADALMALEAGYLAEGEFFAKNALETLPRLADAKNAVGLSKIGRDDWGDAADWFGAAADSDPDWATPRFNADLARFLSGDGDDEQEMDAIRKAVFHDPTHSDGFYIAGRRLEREDRLDESASAYRRQIDVNPQHARARFDLGRVHYRQGRIDSAAAIWHELMEARPDQRSICVAPVLDAYIRVGETGKAQQLIGDELRTLTPEARARVEDIALVAGPDEMAEYVSLPDEEKPRFVRAFWQKRDPTPATPGNERLVEHYRRVVYAINNYPSKKSGWDRRGDVYIRYGEPAHISRHDDIRYETDPEVVRVRERLMRSLTSEAREEIFARAGRYRTSTGDRTIIGEYGQKVEYHDFEAIDFEMNPNRSYFIGEQDNSNRYVRGTEEATYRGRMRERPIHGLPLYPVDGGTTWEYWIYPDVAGGIEVVFTALTPKGELDYPAIPMGRKLARFNEKFWDERRSELVVARARSQQPDRYLPPGDALDFHFATADFRGPEDRSRLEVYYGVPVLDLVGGATGGSSASEDVDPELFERGVALFDSTWTPVYRTTTPMAFSHDRDATEKGTLAIDEIGLKVKPGRYYLGVQVKHPASNRWNGYTQELIVDDYTSDNLSLSDIEIAGSVESDENVSTKGGLRVVPMPSRTFNPGQPVLIYYEIYGLSRDEFGQTKHRVDYEIRPQKGKLSAVRVLRALGKLLGFEEKAIVTISYERTGDESDEQNYLEIDPGESKEGVYQLTVTVTDQVSGSTTEKNTTFLIGE